MSLRQILLIWILFTFIGCLPTDDGQTSFSSNSCFNGQGPVNPRPSLPNFVKSFGLPTRTGPIDQLHLTAQLLAPTDSRLIPAFTNLTVVSNLNCQTGYATNPLAKVVVLRNDTSVANLEKWFWNQPCVLNISPEVSLKAFAATNDPLYSDLSHLTTIQATQAYNFLLGPTGPTANVVIAIIDTGVDIDHEDLTANTWVNPGEIPGNGIDDDHNGYVDDVNGYNFASNIANPRPQAWPSPDTGGEAHGTHVAGLAAARANNNKGITGVMGINIKIMALNVFGATNSATTANLVNAIYYAANNGANVINMSLGGYGTSTAISQALSYAVGKGVVILAAAGNDSAVLDDSIFMLPASYAMSIQGMLSVGATDDLGGGLAFFSNKSNRYVEVAAPGTNSTVNGLKSTLPGNAYGYKQGTSMATPVAAGVAAWAVSYMRSIGPTPSAAAVEQYMRESADVIPSLYPDVSGGRRLNLNNLVNTITNCYR